MTRDAEHVYDTRDRDHVPSLQCLAKLHRMNLGRIRVSEIGNTKAVCDDPEKYQEGVNLQIPDGCEDAHDGWF